MVEDHGAVIDHRDVFAGDLLAEFAGKHAGVAIDGVSVGCAEEVAHETAGGFGREDDGALLGGDAASAEEAEGAAGGFLAYGFWVFEQAGGAGAGVPVSALHAFFILGDGRGGEAYVGAAVLAVEAARGDHDAVRGGAIEAGAARVLDTGVEGHGGGFATFGDGEAFGGRDAVGVFEEECLGGGVMTAEDIVVGETGEGVYAGDFGEGHGARDEAMYAGFAEIGGGGGSGALTAFGSAEDAQAEGARASLSKLFDLAEADVDVKFVAFVGHDFGIGGTGFEGALEGLFRDGSENGWAGRCARQPGARTCAARGCRSRSENRCRRGSTRSPDDAYVPRAAWGHWQGCA